MTFYQPRDPHGTQSTIMRLWRAGWPGIYLTVPIGATVTYLNGIATHIDGVPLWPARKKGASNA